MTAANTDNSRAQLLRHGDADETILKPDCGPTV
jgi:hypothetical protein